MFSTIFKLYIVYYVCFYPESGKEDGEGGGVFIPGKRILAEDEELIMDHNAYVLYHQATTFAPCLSFDILRDQLGDNRADVFPLTVYIVAGM